MATRRGTLVLFLVAALSAPSASAATRTWSGAGPDAHWSTAANWVEGQAPSPGDDLVFDVGAPQRTAVNDFPAGTVIGSLRFVYGQDNCSAPFTLTGQAIALRADIVVQYCARIVVVQLDVTMLGDATIQTHPFGIIQFLGRVAGAGTLSVRSRVTSNDYCDTDIGGRLQLTGPWEYSGPLDLRSGSFEVLESAAALRQGNPVRLDGCADLRLNGVDMAVGPLEGVYRGFGNLGQESPLVHLGSRDSTVFSVSVPEGVATVFDKGRIEGSGSVQLAAVGTWRLEGALVSASRPTVVHDGTLDLGYHRGTHSTDPTRASELLAGVVVEERGTLQGYGRLGPATVAGVVRPVPPPPVTSALGGKPLAGCFDTGDLTFTDRSALAVTLDTGATGRPTIATTGTVTLGGATLRLSVASIPFAGVTTVIDNDGADPVIGTFAGLPEGSLLQSGGATLRLSYVGGTGNDVTLSVTGVSTYLAEGATSEFFDTRLALLNPSATVTATGTITFQRMDGTIVAQPLSLPPLTRRTLDVKTVPGMGAAEFSTRVDANTWVIVDRTMTWDREQYGAHAETAVAAPATTWYLAEGATHSGFELFYLVQNPGATSAEVEVQYLRPAPQPVLTRTYTVGPSSRFNIWVNHERPELAGTDVSAVLTVTHGPPIIVERAMYLDVPGQAFAAGHESAGITAPAPEWFLAEGATGPYFDLFVLIANPGETDAEVKATFLLPDGTTVERPYTVAAHSRFNVWVDHEDARLADTAVSTTIRSTNDVPVIVERAMWWPEGGWWEAHNAPGATTTGTTWALAEGEVDASRNLETYILVANTSATPADVTVTLLFEDGGSAEQRFNGVPANGRLNVPVGHYFSRAAGKRFGAIVESLGTTPAQIVVERAMYWDAAGQRWAAGTNALATKLR